MDAITREAILSLTKRVADLEAAMEVHRAMLKEATHAQASAAGTSFDDAAFDAHVTEAILAQRETTALGAEPTPATPPVLIIEDPAETA